MAAEIITKEDLQEFKRELIDEIKLLIVRLNHPKEKLEWLRSGQARKLLQVSPGTLQNLRIQDKLRFTKVGHLIYYSRLDIELLMES
ncbi:helix-turn-helix domain-containing protein [Mucilaginibacter sp. E4BP6]|uniref:helix-turn-helix domain-containing protein n=1 Tax=Mucilaginibacter sp. E4BP6 TaxID=2723089 RepID=UPI0015CCC082|nr:helix-turn-helix domain-containing protein [Mucilaginibacter sp. E4BP6]NYE65504.1 hypothetical protein [Mucilaginibacter sp. E4BP6]